MSSIRILKKELNKITRAFTSDSFNMLALHPEKREDIISLISDAVALRNEQIHKLNHFGSGEEADNNKKEYLRMVRKEFFSSVDKLFEQLSKLSGQKSETTISED